MTGPGTVSGGEPSVAVVLLSQGNRPRELARALDSVRAQQGVTRDVVVVGNGWTPARLGPDVRDIALAENIGIPAARNLGARRARGEFVFFLDDDAWLPDPGFLRDVTRLFLGRPGLGAVQARVATSDGVTLRRWVPRVRVGDPTASGPAFTLAEGVTTVRRSAFQVAGGWPEQFFYGHEGIELAWRLWDSGWEVHYAGELVVHHPATVPQRHAVFYRHNARNRVWVARRNLPWPLVPAYLGAWAVISTARLARRPRALVVWWRGFVEGWRTDPGRRRPMRWRTVLRLARLGQPPII